MSPHLELGLQKMEKEIYASVELLPLSEPSDFKQIEKRIRERNFDFSISVHRDGICVVKEIWSPPGADVVTYKSFIARRKLATEVFCGYAVITVGTSRVALVHALAQLAYPHTSEVDNVKTFATYTSGVCDSIYLCHNPNKMRTGPGFFLRWVSAGGLLTSACPDVTGFVVEVATDDDTFKSDARNYGLSVWKCTKRDNVTTVERIHAGRLRIEETPIKDKVDWGHPQYDDSIYPTLSSLVDRADILKYVQTPMRRLTEDCIDNTSRIRGTKEVVRTFFLPCQVPEINNYFKKVKTPTAFMIHNYDVQGEWSAYRLSPDMFGKYVGYRIIGQTYANTDNKLSKFDIVVVSVLTLEDIRRAAYVRDMLHVIPEDVKHLLLKTVSVGPHSFIGMNYNNLTIEEGFVVAYINNDDIQSEDKVCGWYAAVQTTRNTTTGELDYHILVFEVTPTTTTGRVSCVGLLVKEPIRFSAHTGTAFVLRDAFERCGPTVCDFLFGTSSIAAVIHDICDYLQARCIALLTGKELVASAKSTETEEDVRVKLVNGEYTPGDPPELLTKKKEDTPVVDAFRIVTTSDPRVIPYAVKAWDEMLDNKVCLPTEIMVSANCQFFAAFDTENKIIGMIVFVHVGNGQMYINIGHVLKQYRGRGLYSSMIGRLKDWGRENGYTSIVSTISERNVPMLKAAQKQDRTMEKFVRTQIDL